MKPLDTTVKGSPGTLGASANFLDRYADGLDQSVTDINTTENLREGGWHGPASDACGDADRPLRSDVRELRHHVRTVSKAERDFEDELNAVVRNMQRGRDVARAGGLAFNGPYIMPPTPPGPAPQPAAGPYPPLEAQKVAQQNAADRAAHQAACAEFNRKRKAYFDAKAIIDQARTDEKNAHDKLANTVAPASKEVRSLRTIGEKGITWAATYVKATHGTAQELFDKADDALRTGKVYQNFNAGNLINLTAEEKALLNWGQTHAQGLAGDYTKKAEQLERFTAKIPKKVKDAIANHPGKSLEKVAGGAKWLKWSKPALKGMPYVGSVVNLGTNLVDAASGEKSFGRAAADFGAETAGGAVGGWAGGALVGAIAGSEVPVAGTIIGGVAGAFLGTAAADKAVDFIADHGAEAKEAFTRGSAAYGRIKGQQGPF